MDSDIIQLIKAKKPYIVAIAGGPGSGKTTLSQKIKEHLECIVLPMDGYHIYRRDLSAQGHLRRGAAFTFDSKRFQHDIQKLKKQRQGSFPTFDHSQKDPKQNAITINPQDPLIIVQGLYLFYPEWHMLPLWDLKIWLECPIDIAMERVAKRHLQCGIQPTLEKATERANNNDRLNFLQINERSNKDGCVILLTS